jgi:hypothetical protein
MTFSYSGNPQSNDKDKVRFLVGDTDANSPLLQNEEIDYLISSESNIIMAAVAGCLAIAAHFSRLTDESVGDVSKSYGQRAEHYRDLAKSLRQRNAEMSVCPYAGGISVSEKQNNAADTDRVSPSFTRELHDDPSVTEVTEYDPNVHD